LLKLIQSFATFICNNICQKVVHMLRGTAITISYTAGITALLMLIFPKFKADLELMWYLLNNGGKLGFSLSWINSDNFFPIFLGFCGVAAGALLWWHHRPKF
jgi:hypothetical protein